MKPSGICWTTTIPGASVGMASRMIRKASVPPVEAPIATTVSVGARGAGLAEGGRTTSAVKRGVGGRLLMRRGIAREVAAARTASIRMTADSWRNCFTARRGFVTTSTAPSSSASRPTAVPGPVSAEQIKVAYSGVSASGTPLWLAKEEGIFAKHGLDAELITVRSAPIQVSALVSNEVQFVRGSASSMLTAAAQGAKLKILFSLFAERASYDFLVSPSISNTRDLRGKKIGVQDFSGLLWSLTMLSLREMGLDPQRDNINIQAIGDSTVIAQSLATGIIDYTLSHRHPVIAGFYSETCKARFHQPI